MQKLVYKGHLNVTGTELKFDSKSELWFMRSTSQKCIILFFARVLTNECTNTKSLKHNAVYTTNSLIISLAKMLFPTVNPKMQCVVVTNGPNLIWC